MSVTEHEGNQAEVTFSRCLQTVSTELESQICFPVATQRTANVASVVSISTSLSTYIFNILSRNRSVL
jgi:hypothetical protein